MMVKRVYVGNPNRINYACIPALVYGSGRCVASLHDKMINYSRVQLIDVHTKLNLYEI